MKKTGDKRRVQMVEKEIQAVLGMYLINGFSEPLDLFITLSRTVVSADLKFAKVYFTVLPKGGTGADHVDESAAEETEELLNEHAHEFQHHIAKELKLRFTPKVSFFHDRSVEKVMKVDKLLNELSRQNKSDDE
ncbi:MAG: 30S ribosome-binding factor RbfA [Bdellovibrionaceae bacterium]|nr:30S ribosome-binding factor RbfA [Pseudobdellovibrionaceae bacterium]